MNLTDNSFDKHRPYPTLKTSSQKMISISASELTLKTSFLTLDKSSFALEASCLAS